METTAIAACADRLVDAWRSGSTIEAPSRLLPAFTRADAVEIAEAVRARRLADGAVPIGYKVGFTNAAVRAQFAADGPMWATVYDQTLRPTPRLEAGTLLGPRIEPEIVVGIGDTGDVEWAALAFEIVQSHIPHWDFAYLDAIADFGLHAALIIGERRSLDLGDLERLGTLPVVLRCDGTIVERGNAADVDGGAAGSVAWLRDDLRHVGRTLAPGDIISTGSMTRVPSIAAGQRWTIESPPEAFAPLTIDVV
jgi:2-keto-4-pentenoate hydratase